MSGKNCDISGVLSCFLLLRFGDNFLILEALIVL